MAQAEAWRLTSAHLFRVPLPMPHPKHKPSAGRSVSGAAAKVRDTALQSATGVVASSLALAPCPCIARVHCSMCSS